MPRSGNTRDLRVNGRLVVQVHGPEAYDYDSVNGEVIGYTATVLGWARHGVTVGVGPTPEAAVDSLFERMGVTDRSDYAIRDPEPTSGVRASTT